MAYIITPPPQQRRYLVFTSAGDANNIKYWLGERSFDLWVCYYGDQPAYLNKIADFYFERKGGKLQNFSFALDNWRSALKGYKAIILADDDIIISVSEINKLFKIRDSYDLMALQPAFDCRGKNSHKFNEQVPFSKLRFTNFVEIGFVLFERKALLEFMRLYDPVVNCWGVDWWFSFVITQKFGQKSLAVVDEIVCLNPYDQDKPDGSEIKKLSSLDSLAQTWNKFQSENNIVTQEGQYTEYRRIKSFNIRIFFGYIFRKYKHIHKRLVRKIRGWKV